MSGLDLYLKIFWVVLGSVFVYASLRNWLHTRSWREGFVIITEVEYTGVQRGSSELAGPETYWLRGILLDPYDTAVGNGVSLGAHEADSQAWVGKKYPCWYEPKVRSNNTIRRFSLSKGLHPWSAIGTIVGLALIAGALLLG